MKFPKTMQALAVVVLMLFAVSTLAAKSNRTTVTVSDPVMVNGKTLASGQYTVTWEGSGDQVQVSFLQGKKVVATASAKLVQADVAYDSSALITKQDGNGLNLVAIQPRGSKQSLALSGSESMSGQQ